MSKPKFVPNRAIFFANGTQYTLFADEDRGDLWIMLENDKESSGITLSRDRARRVAQAILRWADGTSEPEEI